MLPSRGSSQSSGVSGGSIPTPDDEPEEAKVSSLSSVETDDDGLGFLDGSYKDSIKSQEKADLENADEDDLKKAKRRKVLTYVGLGIIVLLLIGLMAAGTWIGLHPKTLQTAHKGSDDTSLGTTGGSGGGAAQTKAESETFMDSLDVPKYYQQPNTKISAEDKAKADAQAVKDAPIDAQLALAPSSGMTSDDSKAFNDDGTINQNYSYLTMDNVVPTISDDIQRLINPVYGQWTGLQQQSRTDMNGNSDSSYLSNLSSMFSQDVAQSMVDDASLQKVANIYADWNKDEYGGEWKGKLYSDPIVGVLKGETCQFAIQGTEEDHIDCYIDVEYTGKSAVNDLRKEHSVTKRMGLHYKVNYDETQYSSRRILLTSVEQK